MGTAAVLTILKALLASGVLAPVINGGVAAIKNVTGTGGWKAALAQGGVAAVGALGATFLGWNPFADGTGAAALGEGAAITALAGGGAILSNVAFQGWKSSQGK